MANGTNIKSLKQLADHPIKVLIEYDPPLDKGIAPFVVFLVSMGVETFESCEGGEGHAYPEPTVRFHGGFAEGYKAVGYALEHNFNVSELRRVWPLLDGALTGPCWEITLTCPVD